MAGFDRGTLFLFLSLSVSLHALAILAPGTDFPDGGQTAGGQPDGIQVRLARSGADAASPVLAEPPPLTTGRGTAGAADGMAEPLSRAKTVLRSSDPRYFRNDEVDTPARPASRPELIYPEKAYFSKLSGVVRARIYIDESGGVNAVAILNVSPDHQAFADSAETALKSTRFTPASIAGRNVKSQKIIEVVFNAEEDAARLPGPPSNG